MSVFSNVITPQGLEPLQFPTKFRSHSTLGAVAWPMLRRAGFSAETGGGILSASGIGAIMAPPTMGAAAFLIERSS